MKKRLAHFGVKGLERKGNKQAVVVVQERRKKRKSTEGTKTENEKKKNIF
jgi:hypothetical protein